MIIGKVKFFMRLTGLSLMLCSIVSHAADSSPTVMINGNAYPVPSSPAQLKSDNSAATPSSKTSAATSGVKTLAATAAPLPALWCGGKVLNELLGAGGDLEIYPDWRGDWIYLCNTVTAYRGIDPGVCKAWYAAAVVATQTHANTTTTFWTPSVASCAQMGTYGNADSAGYFLMSTP